ncbi:Na-translocating system protein MpsC family protein [Metabacillus bambusae]|uniref:DUF2294 family protein n=1 Tax=Metabacillus bambusae TaxID=2795218 RepID=A0ABS3N4C3_9BACI|nr:Na-translocating system protein MpsC family protein [Metabacillus bambusae]MBO1512990.1 DUF2294 family protein [Metabacillus bambusae]
MQIQDQLSYISGYTSKLLRQKFGRGPQSCQATVNQKHLVIYIRGFLSPMEEVLLSQGQNDIIDLIRIAIIKSVLEELKGVIQVTIQTEVCDFYHDWNIPNNSGILMFVLNNPIIQDNEHIQLDTNEFEAEISRLSALVQKVPDEIILYPLSRQILLVERKGILVPIEKALISKGFDEELRVVKDELEKKYFHRNGKFDELLKQRVVDIFIDWNLKDDKSLMSFIIHNR